MTRLIRFICFAFLILNARAELPLARLTSVFPPGGQVGTTLQVTCEGADLDDASAIHFSAPGISTERNPTNPPGVFTVSIATNVPPGNYEARVVGRFGISNPRFFSVDNRTNLIAHSGNQSPETALTLPVESTVSAAATASAADYYKFETVTNEPVLIACQAEPFDSKMKPALLLFDSAGRELMRDRIDGRLIFNPHENGSYILKVHDLEFRGGKQFPYRLTLTRRIDADLPPRLVRLPVHDIPSGQLVAEQESNDHNAQKISVPCEIRGQFFPEGDVDRFVFDAKKGDVFWIEVTCDRAGQPSDPYVLIQQILPNEKTKDVQEFYSSDANLGGPVFNTTSRDPSGRLEIKEDGTYRLQVRDLFKRHPDSRLTYRLSIRKPAPDFDLIALVTPPPTFEKDKRDAQIWSSFIRRNETILLKVLALRRDDFSGEITLSAAGLPAGVHVSETVIPEGQNAGWLSISADDKAPEWAGKIELMGRAKIGTEQVEHPALGMTVLWDVGDYNNEAVRSRLTQELMLASSTESSPLALEPKQARWQVEQASSVSIPVHLARSAEFKQPVKIRAYLDHQTEPLKEWQVDAGASDTSFELDVKAGKLSTGPHQIFFLGQTSGKIRRVRADELAAFEAEAKKDETKRKEIEAKLQLRDVTAIFSSPVITILVNPATTASK